MPLDKDVEKELSKVVKDAEKTPMRKGWGKRTISELMGESGSLSPYKASRRRIR
jgi:hypothetical protein